MTEPTLLPQGVLGEEDTFSNVMLDEERIQEIPVQIHPPQGCHCPFTRYIQVFLAAVGFVITFGIRCNVGVAVVKMMSYITDDNGDVIEPEFSWSPETIGRVDSSYFCGYLATQIPGGLLASLVPANRLFGAAIVLVSLLNLLLPAATMLDPHAVIVLRVIQGLLDGVTFPSLYGILRWWAPPLERTMMATIPLAGSYGGICLGMLTSGFLADLIGWYAPYYFYGMAGIIWYVFWLWLSSEKPAMHRFIFPREQSYIERGMNDFKEEDSVLCGTSWGKVLACIPLWAILVAKFCHSWNLYLLLIIQPWYFKEVFGMSYSLPLTILPSLLMTIIVPLGGLLADHLRRKKALSTTNVRKIFNCVGLGGQALSMLVLVLTRDKIIAMIALSFAALSSGIANSGFSVNLLDIGPRHTSILLGVSNSVGIVSGIICSIFTKIMIDVSNKSMLMNGWQYVFIFSSVVSFIGVFVCAIFTSGEVQDWSKTSKKSEEMLMNDDVKKQP